MQIAKIGNVLFAKKYFNHCKYLLAYSETTAFNSKYMSVAFQSILNKESKNKSNSWQSYESVFQKLPSV